MRIVHLIPYFAPAFVYGGPPRSVLGLCHGLQQVGADVAVVTSTANGESELPADVTARGRFDGVSVTYVPRSFPKHNFAVSGLARALERHRDDCDLVHIHGCWNLFGWAAARWCQRERMPYVVSPRGMLHPWSFANRPIAKWLGYRLREAKVLRGARFIHATSTDEADVVANLNVNGRIVMVPNGVEPAVAPAETSVAAFRERLRVAPDDFVILFLGRLHRKKGLDTLFAAYRSLVAKQPRARLVVAGSGEPSYEQELADATRDLGDRVIFPGFLDGDDRRLAFASADAFVLTSHSENFGLSVAEAMAAAQPVVVSRGCPWPEIETWRAGFWVENTQASVAAALEALASDPEKARTMGVNGREAVRQHLDWTRLAGQMLDAYSEHTH